MATIKYSKDLPPGSSNSIQRVAIVGATGNLGSQIANELIAIGKHTVTAITRLGSTSEIPSGIASKPVDYNDKNSLIEALKDQQFLIICLSPRAPKDAEEKIISAAKLAGVTWVMPTNYGPDAQNLQLAEEGLSGINVRRNIKSAQDAGISWIAVVCSFWYEFSLGLGGFGFDIENKKVTLFDNGETKINTTTFGQCARAIATLLSLKELPEDENDIQPTISKWRDDYLYISSFTINQREMLNSLHCVMETTDSDWKIIYEDVEARYSRGIDKMRAAGNDSHQGFVLAMYARIFYPNGDGLYEKKYELANKPLELPVENIDEATKLGVGISRNGVKGSYKHAKD